MIFDGSYVTVRNVQARCCQQDKNARGKNGERFAVVSKGVFDSLNLP